MIMKKVIMDINMIPEEFKDNEGRADYKKYGEAFGIKVLPLDLSPRNLHRQDSNPTIIIL